MKNNALCIVLWSTALTGAASWSHGEPLKATLLKSETSWDGGAIAYPKGFAEIEAVKISLKEGEFIPLHCHPVPTMGYVLSGTIRVTLPSGKEMMFSQGQAALEVQRTMHKSMAVGGPAEFVVFYAGARGQATTFPQDSKECIDGTHTLTDGSGAAGPAASAQSSDAADVSQPATRAAQ